MKTRISILVLLLIVICTGMAQVGLSPSEQAIANQKLNAIPKITTQKPVIAIGPQHQYVRVLPNHNHVATNVSDEMEKKLNEFVKVKKHVVMDIEFTPTGGWTIVTNKDSWTRNVGGDYFAELQKIYNAGNYVIDVDFNPAFWKELRGFSIATSTGEVKSKYIGGTHTQHDQWLLREHNKKK